MAGVGLLKTHRHHKVRVGKGGLTPLCASPQGLARRVGAKRRPPAPARKKPFAFANGFFQRNKSLVGFVKCPSGVKYASRVKCAAAREGIYFISHSVEDGIFHNFRKEIISHWARAEYFTYSVEYRSSKPGADGQRRLGAATFPL